DLHDPDDSVWVGDDQFCPDCRERILIRCNSCDEYEYREDARFGPGIVVCDGCYQDHYFYCEDCEQLCHYEDHGGDGYCYQCNSNDIEEYRVPRTHNVEATVESGTCRDDDRTFGVEIETNGHFPWSLGGYHSDTPAPEGFFSGWRAEDDCTVAGEFISPSTPPLKGAEGLAEIIATYRHLYRNGCRITGTNCGQHTTVSVYDVDPSEVMRLMLAMEEAMFATTAAYGRMRRGSYAYRIKPSSQLYTVEKGSYICDTHSSASVRHGGELVEFRYPPGTLKDVQGVLNVGLCKMLVELARDLSHDALVRLSKEAIGYEVEGHMTPFERIHKQVRLGVRLMVERGGWHQGGEFRGLPYDPEDPPTITLTDPYADPNTQTIALPHGSALLERMDHQIAKFYERMAEDLGEYPEKAVIAHEEIRAMFPARTRAKETA
ncbi:MAG: hypothetical protein M3P49_12750, partial [Actinomycetota bacterium]|nr:hypothetical protein [Actinomycetota bacterium]